MSREKRYGALFQRPYTTAAAWAIYERQTTSCDYLSQADSLEGDGACAYIPAAEAKALALQARPEAQP